LSASKLNLASLMNTCRSQNLILVPVALRVTR